MSTLTHRNRVGFREREREMGKGNLLLNQNLWKGIELKVSVFNDSTHVTNILCDNKKVQLFH